MKRLSHFLTQAAIFVSLTATLGVAPAHAVGGKPAIDNDSLVAGVAQDFNSLDALLISGLDPMRQVWQLYDTLYSFAPDGRLEPRVATDYAISNDGLRYSFTLRDGVRFHDGTTLTSADVQFSIERILDPAARSTRRANFVNLIERVWTEGDHRVHFDLKKPDGAFVAKLAGHLFLVPKAHVESLQNPASFGDAPVSVGPYRFVSRQIGRSLELERFDGYYGKRPDIRRIIYRVIPDASSRVNALVAGEVDWIDQVPKADTARLVKHGGLSVADAYNGGAARATLFERAALSPRPP